VEEYDVVGLCLGWRHEECMQNFSAESCSKMPKCNTVTFI
jgi:hypothetical protein